MTRAGCEENHDRRFSIEERYGSRARYQAIVTDRASNLAEEGYLLRDDIPAVVDRALAHWDDVTKRTTLSAK